MTRRPIIATITTIQDDAAADTALRDAFSNWASGIAAVAVRDDGHVYAITATAVTPVSLTPPLLLVCVGPNATVLPFLEEGAEFAVSILSAEQRRQASLIADPGPLSASLFPPDGPPVLADALAAFVCTVESTYPGGDHRIVVGRIVGVADTSAGGPLIYFRRDYHRLPAE
ncbi:MAG TPA: flavin reductase family protein [Longimicrobiales bacterium]|nr:flavin reductase family protein [Longimicrobiales bacterium]